MKRPLFSIILPTFNRAKFIQKSIESVLRQSYPNFELIVVNDGSTDHTKTIVKQFIDPRIRYFYKKNEERGVARNFGLQRATGKYICFLDSDDYYLENHLAVLNTLIQNNQGKVFHPSYKVVNEKGQILGKEIITENISLNQISKGNFLSMNAICLEKKFCLRFPFSSDRKFILGEDLHFWLRILSHEKIIATPSVTSVIVEHQNRTVSSLNPDTIIYSAQKLNSLLQEDKSFQLVCPQGIPKILSYFYAKAAYFYLKNKQKKSGIKSYWKSIKLDPQQILNSQTLSIIYRFFKPN